MVGRRGEAPLVPPYILWTFTLDEAEPRQEIDRSQTHAQHYAFIVTRSTIRQSSQNSSGSMPRRPM